jgi:hypothetical protein
MFVDSSVLAQLYPMEEEARPSPDVVEKRTISASAWDGNLVFFSVAG